MTENTLYELSNADQFPALVPTSDSIFYVVNNPTSDLAASGSCSPQQILDAAGITKSGDYFILSEASVTNKLLVGDGVLASGRVQVAEPTTPAIEIRDDTGSGVIKQQQIVLTSYSTVEEPLCLISGQAGSAGNDVHIGGGAALPAAVNSAVYLRFYSAAAVNTLVGREIIRAGGTPGNVLVMPTGAGGSDFADASAGLEIRSTTQGFLPPVLTTAERDAISTPATGLVVYNSTTNVLNFYNGSAWGAV